MAEEKKKGDPTWGYKLVDDEVVSKLFPEGLEKGWADTPAKLKK